MYRLRKVCWEPIDDDDRHQLKETSYLRSAILSLAKAPPSRGKLVLNTPFLDAGVPASSDTRSINGVYAGGNRRYYATL
jgi:hypothetical protein